MKIAIDAATSRCSQIFDLLEKSEALRSKIDAHSRTLAWNKLSTLMPIAQTLFSRMHANRVFDKIHPESEAAPLEWLADAGDITVNPQSVFSHGQRQDLALSLFLAKACLQGGTFVLDEPVAHLDDLNRVAVLDLFRVLALTLGNRLNLVITTSSRNLMRHLREKFALVSHANNSSAPVRIYQLEGNPRIGVTQV